MPIEMRKAGVEEIPPHLTEQAKAERIAALTVGGAMPDGMAEQLNSWLNDHRCGSSRWLKWCQVAGALFAAARGGGELENGKIHPLCRVLEDFLKETARKEAGALQKPELIKAIQYPIYSLRYCGEWSGQEPHQGEEGRRTFQWSVRMIDRYTRGVAQAIGSEGSEILPGLLWEAMSDMHPRMFQEHVESRDSQVAVFEAIGLYSMELRSSVMGRLRNMAATEEVGWLKDYIVQVIEDLIDMGNSWPHGAKTRVRVRNTRKPQPRTLSEWRTEIRRHPYGRETTYFMSPDIEAEARAAAQRQIQKEDEERRKREEAEGVNTKGATLDYIHQDAWLGYNPALDIMLDEPIAVAAETVERVRARNQAREQQRLAAQRERVIAHALGAGVAQDERQRQQQLLNQMRREQRSGRGNHQANMRLRRR